MAGGVKKLQTAVCLNSEEARQDGNVEIKRTLRNVIVQPGEKTRTTNPNFFLELEPR